MSDLSKIAVLAGLGKAAGDTIRLEILQVLKTDSLGVLELAYIMQMRQPALSHHLKVMTKNGLITARKEGNVIFYRRVLPSQSIFGQIIMAIFTTVDQWPLCGKRQTRLESIRMQRAEQSLRFFEKNSHRFHQQQEIIADHTLYSQNVMKLLEHITLPAYECAVELGPGEGLFLPALSSLFQQVLAVDNSEDMLKKAKHTVNSSALNNIDCVLGEANNLLLAPWHKAACVDCIVANMVLHHMPAPATIFGQSVKLLKPGGSLLVSELSAHDQSWVKQSCGDLWLGFSPEELNIWAKAAGLIVKEAQYLALRNGFQIQIRRFVRAKQIIEDK